MPTYEYRCKECGHELEAVQSFSDAPLTECPSCGGPLRKVFAAPGISFKGSGFYKNDSRSGSSSSGSSAQGDGSPSSTSDTSPPAKKEATTSSSSSDGAKGASPSTKEAASA